MQNSLFNLSHDINLYNEDSYSFFNELRDSNIVVDHIITDPPYNISKENNFNTMSNAKRQGVDFGEWDKEFDLLSWIDMYSQILSKNGSMIIFNSYRHLSHIIERMENNDICVKDVIVWQKSNPMPRNTDRRYVQDMEFAIWGVKRGAKWVFNKPDDVSYLRGLLQASVVSGKEKTGHPTQKSLKIMEEIIKIHTNKGQVVLDPFMGSGSTGVACQNLERKFIGIEKEKEYFEMVQSRLKLKQFVLDGIN